LGEPTLKTGLKTIVLDLLNEHRIMSISTNRPDGWPQTTLVGYVNDGFLLYCFVAQNSQKYANIRRDPRVSIAIGSDAADPRNIKGLSLAGMASLVTDRGEVEHVSALRRKRYPEYAALSPPVQGSMPETAPEPGPRLVVMVRIAPEIISVVDYSKGFGHSDLITFSERDLDLHIASLDHQWVDSTPG
jgi:general stress protein 26